MYKKALFLVFMSYCVVHAGRSGAGSDVGLNAGATVVKHLLEPEVIAEAQKLSACAGQNFGFESTKLVTETLKSEGFKQTVDKSLAAGQVMSADLGKNAGATAATALGAATVTTAKIGACVAAAAGTVYVAEKVADRCFPVEQEQAKRAEAAVEAFKSTATLEDMKAERGADQAFTQCLTHFPKQVRNSLECPANCMNDYRKLALLGQQAVADEKLVRLKKADDGPVPVMSAHDAEQEVRRSFEENKSGPMRTIETVKSTYYSWLWSSPSVTIELPEKAIALLESRSSLDPARFAKLYAEVITAKYAHIKACLADVVLDKKGYPARIAVHLKIDGNKVYAKTGPAIV